MDLQDYIILDNFDRSNFTLYLLKEVGEIESVRKFGYMMDLVKDFMRDKGFDIGYEFPGRFGANISDKSFSEDLMLLNYNDLLRILPTTEYYRLPLSKVQITKTGSRSYNDVMGTDFKNIFGKENLEEIVDYFKQLNTMSDKELLEKCYQDNT